MPSTVLLLVPGRAALKTGMLAAAHSRRRGGSCTDRAAGAGQKGRADVLCLRWGRGGGGGCRQRREG